MLLAPGQTAGASGNATRSSTVISHASNGLAAIAAQYGAIAYVDAPKDTVGNAEGWAANNLRDRVLGCFNYVEVAGADVAPSGPVAGAVALNTRTNGRAASTIGAPVIGIDGIHVPIGHTPRVSAGTDESKLVAAYLTPIVAADGAFAIMGGYLKNAVDDVSKLLPVRRVLDHLEHIIEVTGAQYLRTHSLATPDDVAGACERAGRALVPEELDALTMTPHPTRNTEAARTQGDVFLSADVRVRGINIAIHIDATVRLGSP